MIFKILPALLAIFLVPAIPVIAVEQPVASHSMDFSGGLNDTSPPIYLKSEESPNAMNVVVDEPIGALKQRNGWESCGTTPSGNTATALYEYSKKDGSNRLIVSDNISIWETADCIVFSTIVTGLGANDTPSFKTVRDNLWIVNGSTHPIVWTGTTASQLDGLSGRPDAPNGKFIEFWKERVWISRTTTEPSSVFFSDLDDGAGNIYDPATSTMAWANALNTIYVGREDGSPIYGLHVYRDNLLVFKDTGISRILYESDLDLSLTKPVSGIGTRFNDTIVEMDDGLLYFMGLDGLYAYDGSSLVRISDNIQQAFAKFKQPLRLEKYKIWDTASDFLNGTLSNLSTSTIPGSLVLSNADTTQSFDTWTDGDYTASPVWTIAGTNWFSAANYRLEYTTTTIPATGSYATRVRGSGRAYATVTNPYNVGTSSFTMSIMAGYDKDTRTCATGVQPWVGYYGFKTSAEVFMFASATGENNNSYSLAYDYDGEWSRINSLDSTAKVTLFKNVGGVKTSLGTATCQVFASSAISSACNQYATMPLREVTFKDDFRVVKDATSITVYGTKCSTITATISDSYNGQYFVFVSSMSEYQYSFNATQLANTEVLYPKAYIDNLSISSGGYVASGTFTSEISTATSLAVWRVFDVNQTLNGQSITYQIKTASSVVQVDAKAYRDIVPGSQVDTTTDTYSRWKATLTTTDNLYTPVLNNGSISWDTGSMAISRISALLYKSRYWLTGSTTTSNDYNDMILVKSKSPSKAFVPYDLGVSAFTTWNGNLYGAISNTSTIARLDTGSRDGTAAITSWWETKDEVYNSPYYFKRVNELIVDYAKSGNDTLQIGLSSDNGVTFTNRTLNLNASQYNRNVKRFNYDMPQSLNYRVKIYNNKLDFGYTIYGLHTFGTVYDYKGN